VVHFTMYKPSGFLACALNYAMGAAKPRNITLPGALQPPDSPRRSPRRICDDQELLYFTRLPR
jgi:hypothetical protein